jgi:hypothetical protein
MFGTRRRFLAALGTTYASTFAGCSFSTLSGVSNYPIGESIERNGVRVTFNKYITSGNAIAVISGGINPRKETHIAPTGAEYIFAHFTVEHVGEQRRNLPNRGMNPPTNQSFKPDYKGESLERPQLDVISDGFELNGEEMAKYASSYYGENLDGRVYDGKASGWLANTISADFEPSDATYDVSYGDGTTTWKFTS